MKTVEIYGENYSGKWVRSRTACRGIVLREGKLLLSYETGSGLWMIPGGGLEPGEDETACCVREVAEETGFLIRPSDCALVIEEYVYDLKHVNRYYPGMVTDRCERYLTEREAKAGMEPRWLSVEEAKAVFTSYTGAHAMLRSLYHREYTALCELFDENNPVGGLK
ncbi:MAG: NUDIX domain-containing protein [Oscillospiraceae bacterium]|nr:NUDIX domain-containing protein [Oscillospiraceae bacterium]